MSTTTTYAYDKSHRMTSQLNLSTDEQHTFGYNQRDMVTQIVDSSGPDTTRTFTYNGMGERTSMLDGSTQTFLTYDGSKLLTEKTGVGATLGRYRHDSSPLNWVGSGIEFSMSSGTTHNAFSPAFDHRGNVRYAFQGESAYVSYVFDVNGRQLLAAGGVPNTGTGVLTTSRLQGLTGLGFEQLTTTAPFSLIYFTLLLQAQAVFASLSVRLVAALKGIGPIWRQAGPQVVAGGGGSTQDNQPLGPSGAPQDADDPLSIGRLIEQLIKEPDDFFGHDDPTPCCGPDVTEAVWDVLRRVRNKWMGWDITERLGRCANTTPAGSYGNAWEIFELGPTPSEQQKWSAWNGGECAVPVKSCGPSVAFKNECYGPGLVNYVLWGAISELCTNELLMGTWLGSRVEVDDKGSYAGSTFYGWHYLWSGRGWGRKDFNGKPLGPNPDFGAQADLAEIGWRRMAGRPTGPAPKSSLTSTCPAKCREYDGPPMTGIWNPW